MLDDDEYRQVISLRPIGKGGESLRAMFTPMLAEYERITGLGETNPNAVFHHRLSEYGPPCRHCEKPLRTPQARPALVAGGAHFCGAAFGVVRRKTPTHTVGKTDGGLNAQILGASKEAQ